jgi:hypothetical protein
LDHHFFSSMKGSLILTFKIINLQIYRTICTLTPLTTDVNPDGKLCLTASILIGPYIMLLRKYTRRLGSFVTLKAGSLKMNTALEYSTRVAQEGGRRCKKSTLNDLVHLTPLRIPLMNPPLAE